MHGKIAGLCVVLLLLSACGYDIVDERPPAPLGQYTVTAVNGAALPASAGSWWTWETAQVTVADVARATWHITGALTDTEGVTREFDWEFVGTWEAFRDGEVVLTTRFDPESFEATVLTGRWDQAGMTVAGEVVPGEGPYVIRMTKA